MAPEIALQKAIVERLLADAAVAAIVQDRIFDEVPADRLPGKPPYIEIGPINRTRFEGCGRAWQIRIRLFATSVEFGRVEAWALADAMADALDDRGDGETPVDPPELAAPWRITDSLRVTQGGDVIDPLQIKSVFVDVQAVVARSST